MNTRYTVGFIIAAATASLVSLYLIAARLWPQLASHHFANLAAALPIICGIAVLSPIVFRSRTKQ